MLTNEQINIFTELHKKLGESGFKYQFTHGSYGAEFFSVIVENVSNATLSLQLFEVGALEQSRLEGYRKLLVNLIEAA